MPKMLAFRLADAVWVARTNRAAGAGYESARLLQDAETGMEAIFVRYPAGNVTPDHTHPCAHGLVVIEGRLLTQDGEFGPGDLVWYPEGAVGLHGATAEAPVTVLLVSNKPFAITHLPPVTG